MSARGSVLGQRPHDDQAVAVFKAPLGGRVHDSRTEVGDDRLREPGQHPHDRLVVR
ncbi:hypothetical protein Ae406Ps2_6492 [Pseudonocardia sp. Ae406_Ps2]|nr:hypothetical protein Ae406Ps2_6492 [Pseudonocardia sp. Ae406_Ps2]